MAQASHIVPELKSLALVDLSYLFRREWHGLPPDGDVSQPATNVLAQLAKLKDRVEHVIVCLDSKPYWRSKVYPQYKAQREAPSDACIAQFRWLKQRIEQDGYTCAKAETFEADDIIATLAVAYRARGVADIRLIGADKDMMQLVVDGVRVFTPSRKESAVDGFEVYDGPAVHKKFGVPPCFMADYQALLGDESDNIDGVKGCGPKNAAKLLNTYGTLQMVLSAAKRGETEIPERMRNELNAQADNAKLYRQLTGLRTDVPLDVDALLVKQAPKPLVKVEPIAEAEFEPAPSREEPSVFFSDEQVAQLEKEGRIVVEPPKVQTGKYDGLISGEPVREMPKTPMPKVPRPTALAVSPPANDAVIIAPVRHVDENLQPTSLEGLEKVAKYFLNARKNKVATIDEACAIIIRGRELGLTAAAALDNFNVIDGKLSMSADGIFSLAQNDPNCEYMVITETTDERCVCAIKLRNYPKELTHEFTMAMAETAGLARNNNYRRHPGPMLMARCKSGASRRFFSGSARGLYCREELEAHREDV